jgi:hypothetical protein
MTKISRALLLSATVGAMLFGPTGASAESVCVDAGATGLLSPAIAAAVEDLHAALRNGGVVIDATCVPIP